MFAPVPKGGSGKSALVFPISRPSKITGGNHALAVPAEPLVELLGRSQLTRRDQPGDAVHGRFLDEAADQSDAQYRQATSSSSQERDQLRLALGDGPVAGVR